MHQGISSFAIFISNSVGIIISLCEWLNAHTCTHTHTHVRTTTHTHTGGTEVNTIKCHDSGEQRHTHTQEVLRLIL